MLRCFSVCEILILTNVQDVIRKLQFEDPIVVQSMYIFKVCIVIHDVGCVFSSHVSIPTRNIDTEILSVYLSVCLSVKECLILGWRFGVAVTRWSRSTQLLYIEPG